MRVETLMHLIRITPAKGNGAICTSSSSHPFCELRQKRFIVQAESPSAFLTKSVRTTTMQEKLK